MACHETSVRVENADGLPLRCDVRRPEGAGPFPVVVVLHGFKGFKDWGMFPPTARTLAERGLASVTFDTARNGVGEEPGEFTELEQFAQNTAGGEIADVGRVIDAVGAGELGPDLDAGRLGLLGHSKGGGVVRLRAARDARVRSLVTWAGIASFERWPERALAEWRERGRLDVPNQRTGQVLWLDRSVLEDLQTRREEYDLRAASAALRCPTLTVHGEQDEAVPVSEAADLHDWTGAADKELVRIPATGHTFGAVHPWAGPTPAWEHLVRLTGDWFLRTLS